MSPFSFATVIVAFVVSTYGHDCTKYSLTPSDQSIIDMMKHYLHTSRKADCPVTTSQQDIGVTYVRWGKKTCPEKSDIVYTGQVGGNYYTNKGGGSNWLCLPNDPENGKAYSYSNDGLYGPEYQIHSSNNPSGFPASLYDKEVPCSVCRRKGKVSVLMIADFEWFLEQNVFRIQGISSDNENNNNDKRYHNFKNVKFLTSSSTPAQQDIGVTYVRWGKKACPKNSDTVYTGQAGGNYYGNKGGGSNYLCLPSDPENGNAYSYGNDGLYGAEYYINSGTKPSGLTGSLFQKEVPCAVCRRKEKVSVLMIAGRKSCYKGWQSEYSGFLMSEYKTHHNKDFICIDEDAVPFDDRKSSENSASFYPVRAKCGSLRCPPYKDNTEVFCTFLNLSSLCFKSNAFW
ncbi:Hypothetical predicted protein, partial [Mytilus galloprovincialis]